MTTLTFTPTYNIQPTNNIQSAIAAEQPLVEGQTATTVYIAIDGSHFTYHM